MNDTFQQLYNLIIKEIMPSLSHLTPDQFRAIYTKDIPLPEKKSCALSGKDVYISTEYSYKKFIHEDEIMKRNEKDNFLEPKGEISGLQSALESLSHTAYFKANRMLNSDVIDSSDDVHSSGFIFNSTHIYSSRKVLFSHNITQSEYMMASKGSNSCSFGIGIIDSNSVSNSFDVSWSAKCSNVYFCHDCYDLRDCMLCFHLSSQQYCIANMQFTESEYIALKDKILSEYGQQAANDNGFRLIGQM